MSQPDPYVRQYNFTNFSVNYPTTPLPGVEVDKEYNALKLTTDQILANLVLIQRDDGNLKNLSVGRDQLKAEVAAGINTPAPWAPATAYTVRDSVTVNGIWYWCDTAHTSSSTFSPDSANWTVIINLAADPTFTGAAGSVSTLPDGTVGAPALRFAAETDTGFFRSDTNTIGVACGGVTEYTFGLDAANFYAPLYLQDGSAAAPGVSFTSDTDTGMYAVSSNTLGFTTLGVNRLSISSTVITPTIPLRAAAGAVGTPSYSFSTDTDTGLYSVGADQLGLATGGTVRWTYGSAETIFNAGVLTMGSSATAIRGPSGSAAAPLYSFSGDTDTGVFNVTADVLGLSAGGTNRVRISTTGVAMYAAAGNLIGSGLIVGTDSNLDNIRHHMSNDVNGYPGFLATRSRGTTPAPTIVASGDGVTRLRGQAWDGAAYQTAGELVLAVDGTPGAGSMPGKWFLSTTPTGSATPTTRLSIDATGLFDFNSSQCYRPRLMRWAEVSQEVTAVASTTLDMTLGQSIILAQAVDITTLAITNTPSSNVTFDVTIYRTKDNSATPRTITWPASVKWAGGTPPTLTQTANAVDIIKLHTKDGGTTYYGEVVGLAYA